MKKLQKLLGIDLTYVFKNGGIVTISHTIGTGLGFLVTVLLANFVDSTTYGQYKYIASVAGILGAFTLSGAGSAVLQAVSKGYDGSLFIERDRYIRWSTPSLIFAFIFGGYYIAQGDLILGWGVIIMTVINYIQNIYLLHVSFLNGKKDFTQLNIIRFGTSGSLQADIPVDSFVASTHGLGLDNLLNYYSYQKSAAENSLIDAFILQTQLSSNITIPYVFSGGESLINKFQDGFYKGITVTCPGFYGPQGRILRLPLNSPGLINKLTEFKFNSHRISNFEMETSAIYGLGKLLGHQCLSVNAIVANRVVQQFSKDANATVENLIKKALEVLIA